MLAKLTTVAALGIGLLVGFVDLAWSQTCNPVTCPSNVVTNSEPGECGATVGYGLSVGGCGEFTCVPPSPLVAEPGITTVNCTASVGNCCCSFTISVTDNQGPTVSCPSDIVSAVGPEETSGTVNFDVSAVDNCPVVGGLAVTCTPASGSQFPIGTTSVTCSSTDPAGNTGMCSFNVIIESSRGAPALGAMGLTTLALLLAGAGMWRQVRKGAER